MTLNSLIKNGAPSSPESSSVFVIAEAGVNHNGDMERAKALVDAAAEAGADAVKFQTFRADELVTQTAQKAEYQQRTSEATESQHSMLRRLELASDAHEMLLEHCQEQGISFLSTPFDSKSANFLVETCGVDRLKVPSGEITNGPFLLNLTRHGLPIVLSTGMSTLGEVEEALSVLAFGLTRRGGSDEKPSGDAFRSAFSSPEGRHALQKHVTVLHCTTEYPAPFGEINLRAMDTLRHAFGCRVGLSDHSEGIAIPIAATARGASLIEKHFTLDRQLPGPDHAASLEPDELIAMIQSIRQVETALGTGRKTPTDSEIKNRPVARKSLVARRPIAKGEIFTSEMLAAKRPGTGVSPMRYWELLGETAARDYASDEEIDEKTTNS